MKKTQALLGRPVASDVTAPLYPMRPDFALHSLVFLLYVQWTINSRSAKVRFKFLYLLVVLCFQFHVFYLNLKIVVISFKYIGILNTLNITIWTKSSVVIWHHNKVTFLSRLSYCSFFLKQTLTIWKPGGELLPCMSYIVMCGLKGYRRRQGFAVLMFFECRDAVN